VFSQQGNQEALRMAVESQPTVTQLHVQELDMILDEVEHALGAEKAEKLRQLVSSHQTLTQLIQEKNISIARLRRLLFGPQTERMRDAAGGSSESPRPSTQETSPPDE
jgi:mevalonate kinase